MSLNIRSRLALIFGLFLVAGLSYAYWQIRKLDSEGGCKELKNLSLCVDIWIGNWMSYPLHFEFEPLPKDQEMIGRFRMYRGDFEAMKNKAVKTYEGDILREWESTTGAYGSESFTYYPLTPDEKTKHVSRTWAYMFRVKDVKYVEGAGKDWPFVNRAKGYVYFRTPPQVENGHLLYVPINPQYLRLLPSLDGPPWPSDWNSGECLLRKIEPQWFLSLCRDRVGG